ncbi:hypothetical protein PR048_005444 [Dryococelus australis]|uniref:Uncharacterized protein n=1 Tax=Dryococelus australis TaxID=614101 RepID=A0ABQ9I8A0_9NEOP|nr:hypothetical protein PR048_005444 [Dryococelus australis]
MIHSGKSCYKVIDIPVVFSAVLGPVVNALQGNSVDLIAVGEHITGILDVMKIDHKDTDRITDKILKKKVQDIAMELEIEISVPRHARKQNHTSNPPSDNNVHKNAEFFTNSYELGNVTGELDLRYSSWTKKNFPEEKLKDTEVNDPSVRFEEQRPDLGALWERKG